MRSFILEVRFSQKRTFSFSMSYWRAVPVFRFSVIWRISELLKFWKLKFFSRRNARFTTGTFAISSCTNCYQQHWVAEWQTEFCCSFTVIITVFMIAEILLLCLVTLAHTNWERSPNPVRSTLGVNLSRLLSWSILKLKLVLRTIYDPSTFLWSCDNSKVSKRVFFLEILEVLVFGMKRIFPSFFIKVIKKTSYFYFRELLLESRYCLFKPGATSMIILIDLKKSVRSN